MWQRPFSTYKSPKFYLSFTILVSLILVKYPDRIGPVNTVPYPRGTNGTYLRYLRYLRYVPWRLWQLMACNGWPYCALLI